MNFPMERKNIRYVRITFPLEGNAKDPNEARIKLAKQYQIDGSRGLFDFTDEGPDSVQVEYLTMDLHEDLSWLPEHAARLARIPKRTPI